MTRRERWRADGSNLDNARSVNRNHMFDFGRLRSGAKAFRYAEEQLLYTDHHISHTLCPYYSRWPTRKPVLHRRLPKSRGGGRYVLTYIYRAYSPIYSISQSPRFARVTRPYTAADVVSKRGTLPIQYPSNVQGKKLFAVLSEHAKNGTPSHTYGA